MMQTAENKKKPNNCFSCSSSILLQWTLFHFLIAVERSFFYFYWPFQLVWCNCCDETVPSFAVCSLFSWLLFDCFLFACLLTHPHTHCLAIVDQPKYNYHHQHYHHHHNHHYHHYDHLQHSRQAGTNPQFIWFASLFSSSWPDECLIFWHCASLSVEEGILLPDRVKRASLSLFLYPSGHAPGLQCETQGVSKSSIWVLSTGSLFLSRSFSLSLSLSLFLFHFFAFLPFAIFFSFGAHYDKFKITLHASYHTDHSIQIKTTA